MALDKSTLDAYIQGLYDDDGQLSSADYQLIINYILSNGAPETDPRDLIQVRRGNEIDLPELAQGELAFTLDTEGLFIGGLNGNVRIRDNYKHVAGVIRNTGEGWFIIDDAIHKPINVLNVSDTESEIIIDFSFLESDVKYVGSFVCGCDEEFAQQGYNVGASVTKTQARLRIGRNPGLCGYVYYDTTDSTWKYVGGTSMSGIKNITFSNGIVTIEHDTILTFDFIVQDRDGNYLPSPNAGTSSTQSSFVIKDYTGATVTEPTAAMNFYISRAGTRKVNPQTFIGTATGNLWFIGIFEMVK